MCLNVAADMVFDRVVLFSTPRTIGQVRDTEKALRERHAGLFVKTIDLALADPTGYASILTDLRRHWRANLALRQSETVFRNSVRHSETLLAFGLTSQKTATPGDEITLPLVETTALRIRGA